MQLREVSRARSCGASLAVSRTGNLIHRAQRRHLRDCWGGGWVVRGAESGLGWALGLGALLWHWCLGRRAKPASAPSVELFFPLLLVGLGLPTPSGALRNSAHCW